MRSSTVKRLQRPLGVLVGYSLLHYGIFVLLGVGAAAGMKVLGIKPALRHGVIFGLGVLNAVHYGAFLATDAQLVAVLHARRPWLGAFFGRGKSW